MLRKSKRFACPTLLPAALAVIGTAGAAAAQAPAYGSSPYVAGPRTAGPAEGVVYFDEPLPGPPPRPIQPPALAAAPLTPQALAPEAGPVGGEETVCPACGRRGVGGGRRAKCETCGGDANVPPPLGFYAHSIYALEAELARANFFVIEPWDWIDDTDQLGPGGELHLGALVRKMGPQGAVIRVAPVHDAALNAARKARLAALLAEHGQAEAAASVEVGPSTAEGLRSDEIPIIGSRILMGDGARRGGANPGGYLGGASH